MIDECTCVREGVKGKRTLNARFAAKRMCDVRKCERLGKCKCPSEYKTAN